MSSTMTTGMSMRAGNQYKCIICISICAGALLQEKPIVPISKLITYMHDATR